MTIFIKKIEEKSNDLDFFDYICIVNFLNTNNFR